MDKELLILCKQTITCYAYISHDDHNDYTWSTIPTSFLGRVEFINKIIRDKDGQETISTCTIYCNSDTVIDERDRISYAGAKVLYPEILNIAKNPDEYGNIDHFVIYTK